MNIATPNIVAESATKTKSNVVRLSRFAEMHALQIAEILQPDNPEFKYLPLLPKLKKPFGRSHGWKDSTADLESLFDGVEYGGNGLGVVLGARPYFAFDVDTKKEWKGATNLCRWLGYVIPVDMTEEQAVKFLIEKLDTRIVLTPSGGLHIYWQHEFSFRARFKGKLPTGCEWKGVKGFLVAPGTHTEASADPKGNTFTGTYEIVKDRPIALAPKVILDSLVDFDAPATFSAGAAVGKPVPLDEFMEVIAWVNPDHPRAKWIVQAGSFHNTNLVDVDGESLEHEKLELWLRFCRGEFWKGSKDSWIDGEPSLYTGDSGAEIGWNQIGAKEGGAGYGRLVYAARKNGYSTPSLLDRYIDEIEGETGEAKAETGEAKAETGEADEVVKGLMNANDYMAEDIEYRHIVYDENGDGVIPDHGIVGIISPYGSGKSTLMDQLGYSLATGTPWLGKYQVERRVVISCPLEDEPGSHDRMRAWSMTQYGKAEMPDPSWHFTWKHPLFIDDPKKLAAFAAKVNQVRAGRPVVFTVDTWQALISGIGDGQNDDSKIMGTVNQNIKFLLRKCSDPDAPALAIIAAHPPKMSYYADETKLSWAGVGGTSNDATGILFIVNDGEAGDKRLWVEKARGRKARGDLCRFKLVASETGREDHRGKPKLGMLAVASGGPSVFGEPDTERQKQRRGLMIDCLVGAYQASTSGQSSFEVADLVELWKAAHPEDTKRKTATVADEITGTLFKGKRAFEHKSGLIIEYIKSDRRGQKAKFEIRKPSGEK